MDSYNNYRDIVYDLAEKYPDILLALVDENKTADINVEIIALLAAGKYVHAVKTYQKHMKSDLKTAKDYVDNLRNQKNILFQPEVKGE